MGSCIICGTSVDGHVCSFHEEDIAFTFTGDRPEQLTEGRYYAGTVDGIADFGVFVTIGDAVTGLLHRSELDVRLESLDWEEDDAVFTQVLAVHDNGNVDLGWSIRQSTDEFRGALVDTGDGDTQVETPDEEIPAESGEGPSTPDPDPVGTPEEPAPAKSSVERDAGVDSVAVASRASADDSSEEAATFPERVPIQSLSDRVGSRVSIEGRVVGVRQTSGPTVFTVRDESDMVECAAFEGPGVRAYPSIEAGDLVRLYGEVERRQGELQLETEALEPLEGDEAAAVEERLEDAVKRRAEPDRVDPLADHGPVQAVREEIRAAATTIRRAIIESRPIIVRHPASTDGYLAGVAVERAVLPLLRAEHDRSDAEYRYFDRRPLEDAQYDMADATIDVDRMLSDRDRHGEALPLIILAGTGTTVDSADGLALLDVYDVERVVCNAGPVAERVTEREDRLVHTEAPHTTTTALAAAIAVRVNPGIREEIAHLPAVSYWHDPPEVYVRLAEDLGYPPDATRELREAIALEAYYQAYEDKRELIADLLFERDEDVRGLASHVSEQFRLKLERALRSARAHLEYYETGGVRIALLDTEAYAHRFDFPPTWLLIDALHRTELEEAGGPLITVGLDEASALLRSSEAMSIETIVDHLTETVPAADASGMVRRQGGEVRFLVGERDRVEPALIEAVAPAIETA